MRALRELCDREDIVLIFDEIQCGIARTGSLFAKDQYEVQPDIMTLAKGLGSGLPVGAILSNERVSSAIEFGDHGTTFGGNPMACAAALATINTIEAEGIAAQAEQKGEVLRRKLEKLKKRFPQLKEVRGLGLMVGIEFDFETKPLVADMMERLVAVIRDRIRLHRRARVLTAQTQLSKRVLIFMPFVMIALLMLTKPDYLVPMWETVAGRVMVGMAAGMLIIGSWMMNRIATLRY